MSKNKVKISLKGVSLNKAKARAVANFFRKARAVAIFFKEVLLLYRNTANTDIITVDWACYRPVGPSLNAMVIIAWFLERWGITLKFKHPSNAMWRHFENNTLANSTNRAEQKHRSARQVIVNSRIDQIGHRFISSKYGHEVLTRLSIKEDLQKSANKWFESHIKGDWVAVHYRGTDIRKHKDGAYRRKYRIDLKPYVAYLKEVLDSQCSIFACSDQTEFIDEMKAVFPGRVFARDIKRSCDDKCLHLDFVPFVNCDNQVRDAVYAQERDALIDILILAKAGLIYTTGSGLVNVVRYFNPETKIVSLNGRTIGRGENSMPIPEPDLFKRLSLP